MEAVQRALSALVVLAVVAVAAYLGSVVVLMGLSWAIAGGDLNPLGRFIACCLVSAPAVVALISGRYLYRAQTRGAYLVIGTAGVTLAGSFAAVMLALPYHGGL
ncbi:hypothetical protein ACIB24_05735 [Spongisporangium articulatum]|uniref:Uncharacterized protein n=1 Tax=Spongisporangium articulatum TaxID=3362603 RepID=A0ABW8AJL7_9ACTN